MIELLFKGKMVSGKNQQQVAFVKGRKVIFPNKRFKDWRVSFQSQMLSQLAHNGSVRVPAIKGLGRLEIDYYPGDAIRRDCTGILDAVFHASELKNGGRIVEDDSQFKQVLFVEREIDRENPRAVIRLSEVQ